MLTGSFSSSSRHRHDQRTQQDRNTNLHAAWTTQMPSLVSAYLITKSDMDSMDVDRSTIGQHVFQIDIFGLRGKYGYLVFNILPIINVTECEYRKSIVQNVDEEANVALIHHGLLGASPTQPTVAFTLEALEFYHQLRRCQGNISIQTFVKVLSAIHNVCCI